MTFITMCKSTENSNYFTISEQLPNEYFGCPLRFDLDLDTVKAFLKIHFETTEKYVFRTDLGTSDLNSVLKIAIQTMFGVNASFRNKEIPSKKNTNLNNVEKNIGLCGFSWY